jgi:polyisoprenoid-binding protein YceI
VIRPLSLLAIVTLAACGGAAVPEVQATATSAAATPPTTAPTASATSAPTAGRVVTGGVTFTVMAGSKAIVRVNEQLADRTLPNDAVLTSDKVTGEFTVLPDGGFAPTSKIVVDLDALESDNDLRDGTVKRQVLETRRFPQALFVPTRADGLQLPLPSSGSQTFKLTGQMTIRGVTKQLSFDVTATHGASELKATASVAPAFQFGTFGMTQPRVFSVISIKDEIRLEVQLIAKTAAG